MATQPIASVTDANVFHARFHPKLPLYLALTPIGIAVFTIVGIPLLPLVVPVAFWWARRFVARLTCRLTAETVDIEKGLLFRKELTIPLDRIQDISLREGPVQRYLGLASLRFETAGGGAADQAGDLSLPGILDAGDFRTRVLAQRSRSVSRPSETPATPSEASNGENGETAVSLLREIRDTLRRMERVEAGLEWQHPDERAGERKESASRAPAEGEPPRE